MEAASSWRLAPTGASLQAGSLMTNLTPITNTRIVALLLPLTVAAFLVTSVIVTP